MWNKGTAILCLLLTGGLVNAATFTDWSPAVSVESIPGTDSSFNTVDQDGCPAPTRDGLTIFMASNRPGGKGGLDIWMSRRESADDPGGRPRIWVRRSIRTRMNSARHRSGTDAACCSSARRPADAEARTSTSPGRTSDSHLVLTASLVLANTPRRDGTGPFILAARSTAQEPKPVHSWSNPAGG